MCDYSLELIRSRPAKAGDKLVSTSFPDTPTRGFAAADDRSVAVCLLPGTELSFEKEIRCEGVIFSWSPGHKVAKFQQVNKAKRHAYHDALEFPDGKIVLLTQLREGQHANRVANAGAFVCGGARHEAEGRACRIAGGVDLDPGVKARALIRQPPGDPLCAATGGEQSSRPP